MIKSDQRIKKIENSFAKPQALLNFYRADSAIQMSNPKAAESFFQNAFTLEYDNSYLHALYANFKLQHDQKDCALKHINNALQLNPLECEFWSGRAIIYSSTGQIDKALNDLKKAREIDIFNATTYFAKAHIEKSRGKNRLACSYADSASKFVVNSQLSEQIKTFRYRNCGINYYFDKISPYDVDPLGANLYFYNAVYDVTQTDEPHEKIFIKKKDARITRVTDTKDKIMMGVKNFIKNNYLAFEKEETNFLYYRNNGLRHLVINFKENSKLEESEIEALFAEMKFSEEVVVIMMNNISEGTKIY